MNRILYIDTPYHILVGIFGPADTGDDAKTLAQWEIITPFGWAEIYDFKSYADSPEDVQEWHVQAETDSACRWIFERLGIDG